MSIERALTSCAVAMVFATGCPVQFTVPAEDASGTDGDCSGGTTLCGGACIDLDVDTDHCGGCGNACPLTEACVDGECTTVCPNNLVVCGQACVDVLSDDVHCGRCDDPCEVGRNCVDGECRDTCDDACNEFREVCETGTCICRPGFSLCGTKCVDTRNDPDHCGDCDQPCGGQPCGASACQPDCSAFPARCGDSCTDLSDPLFCGDCDKPCETDKTCVAGECEDA